MNRLALAGALLCGTSLAAQSSADRAALTAWSDSLEHISSASQLSRYDALSRGDAGPLQNLRRSMFKIRSAQLLKNMRARQTGIDNLVQDIAEHPDWVWPRFTLAKEYVALHRERALPGLWAGQQDGESLVESAWRFLRKVYEMDRDFAEARTYLFELMVQAGDRELNGDQVQSVRDEVKLPRPDAKALLVWGRILRASEKYDSALKVYTRAVFAGEDRSRLSFERAHAFLGIHDTVSAQIAYWDGLEDITPKGREAYRYDMAWMLSKDSLAAFDKVPDDSLPAWMHRFWDERDASVANHPGERLLEQIGRWNEVVAHFRVTQPWRKTDFSGLSPMRDGMLLCNKPATELYKDLWALQPALAGDIRERERLLDQRGLIYMHHGAPLKRSPLRPVADTWGESWLYWFEGSWRPLHFTGSQSLGKEAPTTLDSYLKFNLSRYEDMVAWGIPEYTNAFGVLQMDSIMREGGGLGILDPVAPICGSRELAAVVAKGHEDSRLAADTDSDTPPFVTAAWNGMVGMFALGHASEKNGEALVTFAIPTPKLKTEAGPNGHPVWPIWARMVAYQAATGQQVVIDSVRSFDAKVIGGKDDYLTGWFEVPLGPGTWQIALRLTQRGDSSGMFAIQKKLVIDDKPILALSDIVLGVAGVPAWRAPDGGGFPVNPLGIWKQKSVMELYFEVRGVNANASYQTAIRIHENVENAKNLISVSSSDRSDGPLTTVRKSIALELLKPGAYVAVVTITANGRSVERQVAFTVVKP